MKISLNLLLYFVFFSTLLGCGGGSSGGGTTSEKEKEQIRFINAIKSESAIDIQFGENPLIEEIVYGDATEFVEATEGEKVPLRVISTQKVLPILSADEEVKSGAKQSYLLYDEAGKVSLSAIDEKATEPLQGETKLRLINLSEDKAAVDIYLLLPGQKVTDKEVAPAKTGLKFKEVSDYFSFPGGTYDIVYVETAATKELRRASSVTLLKGKIYTHYLLDQIGAALGQTSRLVEDTVF